MPWSRSARPTGDVVAIDGEVGNSTYTEEFAAALPERFVQSYIAEQQMIRTPSACRCAAGSPFAATFAAFLARAYDFVRMAAISRANIDIGGSHAASASARTGRPRWRSRTSPASGPCTARPSCIPATPTRRRRSCRRWRSASGIVFMRTTREKTPILYEPGEAFEIGGSRVVRRSDDDALTIIGAGITLHEAIAAADELAARGSTPASSTSTA